MRRLLKFFELSLNAESTGGMRVVVDHPLGVLGFVFGAPDLPVVDEKQLFFREFLAQTRDKLVGIIST